MEKTILYVVKSVWQAVLFAVVTAALELLVIGVLLLCGLAAPGQLAEDGTIRYLMLLPAQLSALVAVQIFFFVWKKWRNHDAVWKNRISFLCVCLGCLSGVVLVDAFLLGESGQERGRLLALALLTGLPFLGYVLYFIFAERSRLETESRVYQKQAGLYQEWYEGFQKTRKETLAFRHDMNNHFGVLRHLCSNAGGEGGVQEGGGYVLEEIRKYIDSMGVGYNRTGCDTDSGNLMMDFAVDMKKNYAQSRGIPMEVELNIPKEMNYNSMDLVIFLSNLLDNAIEACERMENREAARIVLRLQYKMSNLVVFIKNTYDGHLDGRSSGEQEAVPIGTSKADKTAHGIGMKNVMDIVNKYHGVLRWNAEDGWFCINALLYEFEEREKDEL